MGGGYCAWDRKFPAIPPVALGMGKVGVRAGGSARLLGRDEVALIATSVVRGVIAEGLQREELQSRMFGDIEALLARSPRYTPSAILLWVEDPLSGLSTYIEPLTRRFEQTPTIVICRDIERRGVRTALSAGAAGVLRWADLDCALGPCVRAVQSGQICVPREYGPQIEPPALSSREKQILGLVVMGFTNALIAQQLFLAESTVKSHLSSAFGKLGVRSRNEAVRLIVDPERGFGMGILALGGEPMESLPKAAG